MKLEVNNLSKFYGDFQALNDVSFSIESGKILGLLGRNGAGKTTTIKSIMGIIEPEKGEILFDQKPLNREKIQIGYLPEERGLYLNMSVKDQLFYFGMLNGLDKKTAHKETQNCLEEFGISEYMNKKVKELSKGNKQKIQLISAILHRPQIVILDEPFSGLDPVNVELFKQVVYRLKEEGTTILFSSHRMEDVEEMCDSIVMLKNGTVIENNTVGGLIEKYSKKNTVMLRVNQDIKPLLLHNNHKLSLQTENGFCYEIKYQKREDLSEFYLQLLENHIDLIEIGEPKCSLQSIFVKELAEDGK